MKNMRRALRRHHVARLKAARRFHWGRDLRHDAKVLGQVVDTPCPCSCRMCGNPRRYFEPMTRQELVGQLAFAEQLIEALQFHKLTTQETDKPSA